MAKRRRSCDACQESIALLRAIGEWAMTEAELALPTLEQDVWTEWQSNIELIESPAMWTASFRVMTRSSQMVGCMFDSLPATTVVIDTWCGCKSAASQAQHILAQINLLSLEDAMAPQMCEHYLEEIWSPWRHHVMETATIQQLTNEVIAQDTLLPQPHLPERCCAGRMADRTHLQRRIVPSISAM